jgi:predicted aconitase with swiveling domain
MGRTETPPILVLGAVVPEMCLLSTNENRLSLTAVADWTAISFKNHSYARVEVSDCVGWT